MTTRLPLGKLPAREGAYSFKLKKYLRKSLSPAPVVFGHQTLVKANDYGMFGNDRVGDCVFAGADHETMIWTAEAGTPASFSESTAIRDYSAVTGYSPSDPNSDQGTDMEEAAKYRRKTGIIDVKGARHKVEAYLELPGVSARGQNNPGLPRSIANAAYHFGGVGIGIEFPGTAMDQFDAGQPWDVVPGASIEGGHYVPLVGRIANGNFLVVTWGKLQEVTPAFLTAYVDEAVVYVTSERLKNGKTLEGFDLATLEADLAALGGTTPEPDPTPVPTPTPTPVTDPNVDVLNTWASKHHTGSNAKAAKAWLTYKSAHNL